MRLLGTRFRLDGGSNEDYAGPVYDIYQLLDFVQVGGQARQQPKFFCFNTNTLLLEQISYEMTRNSEVVKVDVQLGSWGSADGLRVPGTITRVENGETVLALTINSAAVTARADDGSFDKP